MPKYLSYREIEAKPKEFKNLFKKVWPTEWRRPFVATRIYSESLYNLLVKKITKFRSIITKFQKRLSKRSEEFTTEIFNLANRGISANDLSQKEFFERVDQFNNEMSAYIGDLIRALETLEKFMELIRNYNIHYDRLPGEFRISQRDDRLFKRAVEKIRKETKIFLKEGVMSSIINFHDMIRDFEIKELSEIISEAQKLVNEGVKLYQKLDAQTIGGRDPKDPKKNMRFQFLKTYFDPEVGLIGTSTIKQVRDSLDKAFQTADRRLKEIHNILTLSEEEVEEIRSRPKQELFISQYLNKLREKREERKFESKKVQKEHEGVIDETVKRIENATLNDVVNYVKDNNIDLDDVNQARYIHQVIQQIWDRKKSKFASNEELMKKLKLDPIVRQRIWLRVLDWYGKDRSVKVGLTLSFRDKDKDQKQLMTN